MLSEGVAQRNHSDQSELSGLSPPQALCVPACLCVFVSDRTLHHLSNSQFSLSDELLASFAGAAAGFGVLHGCNAEPQRGRRQRERASVRSALHSDAGRHPTLLDSLCKLDCCHTIPLRCSSAPALLSGSALRAENRWRSRVRSRVRLAGQSRVLSTRATAACLCMCCSRRPSPRAFSATGSLCAASQPSRSLRELRQGMGRARVCDAQLTESARHGGESVGGVGCDSAIPRPRAFNLHAFDAIASGEGSQEYSTHRSFKIFESI